MSRITYDDLSEALIGVVPELQEKYAAILQEWGEGSPGQHVVYGDLLNSYIPALLEMRGPKDAVQRIFTFLEELANHEDERVQEVVAATVLEYLDAYGFLPRAWSYMREATRRLALNIVMWHPAPQEGDQWAATDVAHYDQRWREEVDALGGPRNVSLLQALAIRDKLAQEIGLRKFSAPDRYALYGGMDEVRYSQRFKEELDRLGGLLKVEGIDVLRTREKLLRELGRPGYLPEGWLGQEEQS